MLSTSTNLLAKGSGTTPAPAAPWPVASGRATRLPGWRARMVHLFLIVFGWGLFIKYWLQVAGQAADSQQLQLLLLGAAIVVPAVTVPWVLHNVLLYRRRGARKSVPRVDLEYRTDYLGRQVAADWTTLADERLIEIGISGTVKFYRGTSVAPHDTSRPRRRDDDEVDSTIGSDAV